MANYSSSPGATQRQVGRGPSRPGSGGRPGQVYKSGWGARVLSLIFFGGIAAVAISLGMDDDFTALPEDAGFIIAGVSIILLGLIWAQQLRARFIFYGDRLEGFGLRGKLWDVFVNQIEGIRYDPTQKGFPFGRGIVIYDRQQRLLIVPRSIRDIQGLGARLTAAHGEQAMPDVFLRLEGGDDIRFDQINVNRDMIVAPDPQTGHQTQYGLRDFQQMFVKSGTLTMNLIGKPVPLRLKIKDILNAHMLMPVIMKAKTLGPRVEIAIPSAQNQFDGTDAMNPVEVTGENKPVR